MMLASIVIIKAVVPYGSERTTPPSRLEKTKPVYEHDHGIRVHLDVVEGSLDHTLSPQTLNSDGALIVRKGTLLVMAPNAELNLVCCPPSGAVGRTGYMTKPCAAMAAVLVVLVLGLHNPGSDHPTVAGGLLGMQSDGDGRDISGDREGGLGLGRGEVDDGDGGGGDRERGLGRRRGDGGDEDGGGGVRGGDSAVGEGRGVTMMEEAAIEGGLGLGRGEGGGGAFNDGFLLFDGDRKIEIGGDREGGLEADGRGV